MYIPPLENFPSHFTLPTPILSLVSLPYVHMTLIMAVIIFYDIVLYLSIAFLTIGCKILEGRDLSSHRFLISNPHSA